MPWLGGVEDVTTSPVPRSLPSTDTPASGVLAGVEAVSGSAALPMPRLTVATAVWPAASVVV